MSDDYVRADLPISITDEELRQLWHDIDCPIWLVRGTDCWAYHPGKNKRAGHIKLASVTSYEGTGDRVHCDRVEGFLADLQQSLRQ